MAEVNVGPVPFAVWEPALGVWRTNQPDLLARWERYCQIWPACGTTRDGSAYRLPAWALRISGGGFSFSRGRLFRTPTASDGARGGETLTKVRARGGQVALTHQLVDLAERRAAMENQPEAAGWWGERQSAVDRWERAVGRPAPEPAARGKSGGWVSSAAFTEWAMGLPEGWVSNPDLGLTRSQQLRALGNGVVPQQAAVALRALLVMRDRSSR
jgi:hypothetical protein